MNCGTDYVELSMHFCPPDDVRRIYSPLSTVQFVLAQRLSERGGGPYAGAGALRSECGFQRLRVSEQTILQHLIVTPLKTMGPIEIIDGAQSNDPDDRQNLVMTIFAMPMSMAFSDAQLLVFAPMAVPVAVIFSDPKVTMSSSPFAVIAVCILNQ